MLEFNASAFFEVTMAIQHTLTSIKIKTSSQESKDGGVMIVPIDDNIFIGIMIDRAIKLREHLNVLDARLTIMYVNRLQKYLDAGFVTYGELSRFYEEICSRLADELHLRKIFVVEGKAEKYFDPEEPLFGREFAYRFQRDGVYELDEAAKCLALGRPTAAVFHLMRLMEIGIGSVARCLQIPDPVKPVERNWGKILERVNSGIAQNGPSRRTVCLVTALYLKVFTLP